MAERANPSRLRVARRRRGLTKVALSRQCGVSTKSLTDFESGNAAPSEGTLRQIAEALSFPERFFYRDDLEEPEPDGVSFRSLKSMTAGQRDSAVAAASLAFEITGWLDLRFELPVASIPSLRDFEPDRAALVLRNHWGIGVRPIGNMVHLLESQGIRVFSLSEKNKQVDAFSLWYHNTPFVFLNTLKTAEHSRMDAAHELGHLVMHRHGARWNRDVEKDAQTFAAAFLMPSESVLSAVHRMNAPSVQYLANLKLNWKVSVAALARKLYDLQLISEWSYRGVCIELSKLGRSNEPNGIDRESSQIFTRVFATNEGGVHRATMARDLDLYTDDVEALIFGLGVTGLAGGGGRRATSKAAEEIRRRFTVHERRPGGRSG